MKKSTARTTSRSKSKEASQALINFVNTTYGKQIPTTFISGVTKLYSKKPYQSTQGLIKRFSNGKYIDSANLTKYLSEKTHHEKGKPLSEEAVRRVYQNCSNPEGKLSFQYIMKMGDQVGRQFPQKLAKAVVRKYGQRKDYLNEEDCVRILASKEPQTKQSKSVSLGKK